MRKLLKYDMKAIFRLWWIFSAAALGVSLLGGACLRMLVNQWAMSPRLQRLTYSTAIAGIVIFVLALVVYSLGTYVLLIWRYYTHFFTDEGYLTFTLPVSRTALLGSKLLTSLIYQAATGAVITLSVMLFVTVGTIGPNFFFNMRELAEELRYIEWSGQGILFIVQGVLLMAAGAALQVLYPYLCATIGAVIAKKQKLLAGIGVFFGGRMAFSFVSQFAFIFFTFFAFDAFYDVMSAILWMEFIALLACAGLAVGCWFVNLFLLKKKLNLS